MKDFLKYKRKSIRLKDFDYSEGNWFYVTVCTHQHKLLFGDISKGKMQLNKFGFLAQKEWNKTKEIRDNIDLDYYVIKPNHLHGILIITHKSEQCRDENSRGVSQYKNISENECRGTGHRAPTIEQFGKPVSGSLPTVIRSFKATVTKQINELRKTPGKPVWQRNYFERIIRNEAELFNIRNYILNNPYKWELEKRIPENLEL
ncbi:transposase [Bacteroidota bacterium]